MRNSVHLKTQKRSEAYCTDGKIQNIERKTAKNEWCENPVKVM